MLTKNTELTIAHLEQQGFIKEIAMQYRWKPSKTKAREFAQKMAEIDEYCLKNNISQSRSSDSYYFTINGEDYRVSNHTVAQSNRGAYNEFGERTRENYHVDGEYDREH